MSAAPQAVFLSYASQDAETATRICEALRAADVEVWFDQSELRGGDAWDLKIRKQIKECALFVPIISANTQARHEGYFRREWKLAVERTHDRADHVAFLVPVVIDETKDLEAHVPEKFREVQWTRLRLRQTSAVAETMTGTQDVADRDVMAAFCRRVRHLLGGGQGPLASSSAPRTIAGTAHSSPEPSVGSPSAFRGKRFGTWQMLALLGIVAIAALLAWRPWAQGSKAGPGNANKSIAVLPFENQSDDKENTAFFADGMHEDILTNLANIRELRVVSRTSVMEYRGTKKKIPQIAQELGVAYILEGSVRRSGNRVRITGQLIHAANDEHLWARNYDRELTAKDMFEIQAALATEIAGALRAVISPETKKLLERRPTENLAAYDAYLKALNVLNSGARGSETRTKTVEKHLKEAVAADPNFAEAWGELAVAHATHLFNYYDYSTTRFREADAAMAHAMRLAPDSPEIIRLLGHYAYNAYRDYERATAQFERVLQLQPSNARASYNLGQVQHLQGRWKQALASMRRAVELEPRNLRHSGNLITTLAIARRWDEAMAECRRILALHPDSLEHQSRLVDIAFNATGSTKEVDEWMARLTPAQRDDPDVLLALRRRALLEGNLAEWKRLDRVAPVPVDEAAVELAAGGDMAGARARLADIPAELRTRLETEPGNAEVWSNLGVVLAVLGRKEEALGAARKAVELLPEERDAFRGRDYVVVLATVQVWSGEHDEAITVLRHLMNVPHSLRAGYSAHALRVDPRFAPLRGDPRFQALLNDPKNNSPLF